MMDWEGACGLWRRTNGIVQSDKRFPVVWAGTL